MICQCDSPTPRTTRSPTRKMATCANCGREFEQRYFWMIQQQDGSYWKSDDTYTIQEIIKEVLIPL